MTIYGEVLFVKLWCTICRNRHPSGVFSYGNSSITLKMMEKNGTMLPGEIYKDLGYVSALTQVVF